MKLHWGLRWATFASILAIVLSIPASLVDEIKGNSLPDNNKVKRAHRDLSSSEEQTRNIPYLNKPTAIKRGVNLKSPSADQQSFSDWEQESNLYQNPDSLANFQSGLYSQNGGNLFDDKTMAEYEKAYQYGTNKEKLDEALENAVLKSELYGEPSSINQYRYYGDEQRRRKRSSIKKIRVNDNRIKRDVDLTPEEFLTILTLYENDRQQNRPWQRFDNNNFDNDELLDQQDDDETWLEAPVYPHSVNDIGPNYQIFNEENKRSNGRWGGFGGEQRKKRFMVSKKRNDPTRELRYLNGPNKNNFYTLSQLLSNQRDPNVPVYHRVVL